MHGHQQCRQHAVLFEDFLEINFVRVTFNIFFLLSDDDTAGDCEILSETGGIYTLN